MARALEAACIGDLVNDEAAKPRCSQTTRESVLVFDDTRGDMTFVNPTWTGWTRPVSKSATLVGGNNDESCAGCGCPPLPRSVWPRGDERCDRLSAISVLRPATHGRELPRTVRMSTEATQSRWVRDLGAVRNLRHSGIVKFVKSVRIGASGLTRAPAPHNDRNGCPHARDAAECRADLAPPDHSFRPLEIDLEPAAGAQPAHASIRPCLRKRGQKMDLSGVALEEHLDHACRHAEVAVDLKRRVRIEEVGVHAASAAIARIRCVDELEQILQQCERAIAIEQARPMIDLPGEAPSRAAIAAQLVRSANRSEELRCPRCDVPARMQSE